MSTFNIYQCLVKILENDRLSSSTNLNDKTILNHFACVVISNMNQMIQLELDINSGVVRRQSVMLCSTECSNCLERDKGDLTRIMA